MSNPHPLPENQFKPGQSGNPGGRPKREWSWSGLLAEAMEEELIAKDGSKGKAKAFVIKRLVRMAIEGDIAAQKEIMNRMDGMPHQTQDITSGGKPLPILGSISNVPINNSDKKDIKTE
jgi:hypothetical protein